MIESCLVVHCWVKRATDATATTQWLQQATFRTANYELSGREFESFGACDSRKMTHNIAPDAGV